MTGRHPLPAVSHLVRTLSSWGIDEVVQVVAYDDAGGSMAAARLWWLLQWLGHKNAAVLNGDWQRWKEGNYPVRSGEEKRAPRTFVAKERPELIMDGDEIKAAMHDGNFRIIDVRAGARYRGEVEPIDPVAGHIPGAISAPFSENLQEDGRFKPPAALRRHYLSLLGEVPAERAVCYCGSGVTAAQGVLTLAHAGLGESKLYPGSWSEWITDPDRPIATG